MSNSLNQCKLRPGWTVKFLAAIQNGYNERNAANMSGESTTTIHRHMEKDPDFKANYDKAIANAKPRYGHGPW